MSLPEGECELSYRNFWHDRDLRMGRYVFRKKSVFISKSEHSGDNFQVRVKNACEDINTGHVVYNLIVFSIWFSSQDFFKSSKLLKKSNRWRHKSITYHVHTKVVSGLK